MNVGDLVQVSMNNALLAPGPDTIGIIVEVWLINNEKWLRVLWQNGSIDSITSHDIKVLSNIDIAEI